MTDNLTVTPGVGADVAADDISSVKYQRIKLIHGADGVNDGDVADDNGLPIESVETEAVGVPTTFDSSTFNNTWQSFVSAPSNPFRLIKIDNDCLIRVYISIDASTIFLGIPAQSSVVIDLKALGLKISGAITIKGAAASTGTIYFNGLTA